MRVPECLAAVAILSFCTMSRADTLTFTVTSGTEIASFQLGSKPPFQVLTPQETLRNLMT